MLTSNVNLEQSQEYGLVGQVMTFKFIDSDIKVIYVKCNDRNSKKVIMQHNHLAR